jgi:hypothetical protein
MQNGKWSHLDNFSLVAVLTGVAIIEYHSSKEDNASLSFKKLAKNISSTSFFHSLTLD